MGPGDDLDALIGQIRLEAARRRAAPDFPLDEEARLGVEMDAQGPTRGGADLAAIVAALRATPKTTKTFDPRELGDLAASAITALAARITELERRTAGPVDRRRAAPDDAQEAPGLEQWSQEVTALVTNPAPSETPSREVLVAGVDVDLVGHWVKAFEQAGARSYGLAEAVGAMDHDVAAGSDGDPASGPVRTGALRAHLQTVGSDALNMALLLGPRPGSATEPLADTAAEMWRVARQVVVGSEAPWAWRTRLGDARADVAALRPIGPEAWLDALTGAGFAATARYGPGGRTYLAVATRKPTS